jgi:UDP-N-acetylmuramyl tripeptide synthase
MSKHPFHHFTWPGEILLKVYPQSLEYFFRKIRKGIVLVAGTNGKTTTSLLICTILKQDSSGVSIVHNATGANLVNGLVSSCIQSSSWTGSFNFDYGVFEVDENALPMVLKNTEFRIQNSERQTILVLLNLFRDQLDRYGEVDLIADKWKKSIKEIQSNTLIVANADDPQIAHLAKESGKKTLFFGIDQKKDYLKEKDHATDSIYCPNCGNLLDYSGIYFSHLGDYRCSKCKFKRPDFSVEKIQSPLPGIYSQYNVQSSAKVGNELGIDQKTIQDAVHNFTPAFGRGEIIKIDDKFVRIFLSKNPAGFNASLRAVLALNPKVIHLVLNDRIPDGRDISWIWDVDFETIPDRIKVVVSGDRALDMGIRMKYTRKQFDSLTTKQMIINEKLDEAIKIGISELDKGETLYILPTYSAMLETREILTGKKIL